MSQNGTLPDTEDIGKRAGTERKEPRVFQNAGPTRVAAALLEGQNLRMTNAFIGTFQNAPAMFSYGYHWPLIVKDGDGYMVNDSKASVTTSKHRTQALYALEAAGYAPQAETDTAHGFTWTRWARARAESPMHTVTMDEDMVRDVLSGLQTWLNVLNEGRYMWDGDPEVELSKEVIQKHMADIIRQTGVKLEPN